MERLSNDESSLKEAFLPVLRFAEFELDLDRGELRRDGQVVALRSKSFTLLATLAARPGHLHSHDELMAAVWPGRVVGDDSLAQCVRELREALGDSSKTLLRSVPRRGYRLDAQPAVRPVVEPSDAEAAVPLMPVAAPTTLPTRRIVLATALGLSTAAAAGIAAWQPWRAPTLAEQRAIAVLPFVNLGADPAQAWFAEAITGEVIEDVSRLPDTLVIAQGSTRQYGTGPPDLRQVARDLDVRFVLTGSVARSEQQVRVRARLSAAETGRVLWSDSFDYPTEREWNWRRDIGPQIAHALDLSLTDVVGDWPPRIGGPLAAVQQSMRGWALFARATVLAEFVAAEALFRGALGIDRQSGAAWAGLANTLGMQIIERWVPSLERSAVMLIEGEAAAKQSLALDPGRSSAAMGLGLVLDLSGRREAAVAMLERCVAIDPSLPRAQVFLAISKAQLGRFDEVPAHIDRALRLCPREPSLQAMGLTVAGQTKFALGDDDAAHALMLRATALNPQQINGWLWLASIDALQGRAEAARDSLQRALRLGSVPTLSAYTTRIGRGTFEARYREGRQRFKRGLRLAGMPD
ncbi:MAG: winged helix-turn-helix domain-containing protein [Burkholderiaceae bacterium]